MPDVRLAAPICTPLTRGRCVAGLTILGIGWGCAAARCRGAFASTARCRFRKSRPRDFEGRQRRELLHASSLDPQFSRRDEGAGEWSTLDREAMPYSKLDPQLLRYKAYRLATDCDEIACCREVDTFSGRQAAVESGGVVRRQHLLIFY